MNITRKERDELNALSQKVYGVSSRWKKILERQKIYNGHEVDAKATEKARKSAQAMLDIGIDNEEVRKMLEAEVKKPTFRSLTVAEVREALEQMSDAKDYAELPKEAAVKKAAEQFLRKSLRFEIALEVPKDQSEAFEENLRQIPKERADQLRRVVVEVAKPSVLTFNGLDFVAALVSLQSPEEASD